MISTTSASSSLRTWFGGRRSAETKGSTNESLSAYLNAGSSSLLDVKRISFGNDSTTSVSSGSSDIDEVHNGTTKPYKQERREQEQDEESSPERPLSSGSGKFLLTPRIIQRNSQYPKGRKHHLD